MADQVTEAHKRFHGPHPTARRCGTHQYNLAADAAKDRPLLGMPRLTIHPATGKEFGWRLRTRARAIARRRAKNRVASRSRARNRRER